MPPDAAPLHYNRLSVALHWGMLLLLGAVYEGRQGFM